MKKFLQTYYQILNKLTIDSDYLMYQQKIQPEPIYLRAYKIINQMVDDPELTPIPKNVFIEILKKIRTKFDNKINLTYKEIYNLLNDYDYEYVEQFKENLLKFNQFNGKLTIAVLKNDQQIFHKFLDEQFDFLKINQLYSSINSQITAVTDSWGKDLTQETIIQKNVLIIINRDLIQKNQQWKDSLQHQITHFIQRVVGFDKSLKRSVTYFGPGNNKKFNEKFQNVWNKILQNTSLNKENLFAYMDRFITYLFHPSQMQPNIKSCLNYFQRMYQNSKIKFKNDKFKNDYKKLENRQVWLQKILSKLNDQNFYSSNQFIFLFDKYFTAKKSKLSFQQMMDYKKLFAFLIYIIFKCNGYDMQSKLKLHFKTFKLRDF